MNLEIDKKNSLKIKSSRLIRLSKKKYTLFIIGDLLSIYKDKIFYSKNESLKYLKNNIDDQNKLEECILNSLGLCTFILRKLNGEIKIYNNHESPGFFYSKINDKIFISFDEIDIVKKLNNKELIDIEIADFIFRDFNKRNSFKSVFKGVLRLPSCNYLIIKKGLKFNNGNFLPIREFNLDNRNFNQIDKDFKFYLESIISVYKKNYKNYNLYSNLSGGIDSTIVTIACKKLGLKTKAFHYTKNPWLTKIIKSLSKKIGVKTRYVHGEYNRSPKKYWENYKFRSLTELKKNLGIYPIDNMNYLDFYKKEKFVIFSGSSFGQLYQILPGVYPIFGTSKFARFLLYLQKGFIIPFLSTQLYIKLLKLPFLISFLEKLFQIKGVLPKNQKQYLTFLAINAVGPYFENFLIKDLSNISKVFFVKYVKYYEKNYTVNFLSKSDLKKLKNNQLTSKEIQNYARLISFNRGVFNNKFHTHKMSESKSIEISPAWAAPFTNFMLKLQIGIREVIFPKGLHYRYFRNELNWSYHDDFIPSTYLFNNVYWHIFTMPIRYLKRKFSQKHIFKDEYEANLVSSKEFKKSYSDYLDINKSLLLNYIKDKRLKETTKKIIIDINNNRNIRLTQVFQIINLEVFLREVIKKK